MWFHSVDIGDGIATRGQKTAEAIRHELRALDLPDLVGKTVLDIGAFDGFYSFEAERRGARRVVALDLQMWEVETLFASDYIQDCRLKGEEPRPPYKTEWLRWELDTVNLPGKKKFDLLRRALNSKVESHVADFVATGAEEIGTFDVVLFLGVLYHLQDPLGAMRRVASLTKETAIIETEAIAVGGLEDKAMCEFFPTNELNGDYSNWWAPNLPALLGMCKAAGFGRVDVKQGPPATGTHKGAPAVTRYRAIVHAWK